MTIFWFRRDLRLDDNAGLYYALKNRSDVQPIFIFDHNILHKLEAKDDARVTFLYDTISSLKERLIKEGSDLWVFYGDPVTIIGDLLKTHNVDALYCNHDYEPKAIQRDLEVLNLCKTNDIAFSSYKDHVIFEKDEVTKDDGKPYTVFTPYKRKWMSTLMSKALNPVDSYYLESYPSGEHLGHLASKSIDQPMLSMTDLGFERSTIAIPPTQVKTEVIQSYHDARNFPAIEGTSRLGIHFRFGTVSIRKYARLACIESETYLSELVWRDFYSQILYHFPHVATNSFRSPYDQIMWRNDTNDFAAWCAGKTGYPIVDAGMRELAATGHMHNRVRMITASFLTKHLLIDWRWGEAWFARHLLDFDLASNNGGWQWAAGSGTDAAPYFRIFSPTAQTLKFDSKLAYIKKWVPELDSLAYPSPIVDDKFARERCLKTYKAALNN
jgi:deoxyribodipyrimidine photo-lyase